MPADDPLRTLERIKGDSRSKLAEARASGDSARVQEVWHEVLGRNRGALTGFLRGLKELPQEIRGVAGSTANEFKAQFEIEWKAAFAEVSAPGAPSFTLPDISLPGVPSLTGRVHPLTLVRLQIEEIFLEMGFTVEDGPEVESDFNNFTALNIPPDHPARDMQDTLYLEGGGLLRTHTSPVQVRTMMKARPPLKIICPGRCFRRDAPDATHSPVFHQVEGLVVDRGVSMADLKGTLLEMGRRLFGDRVKVRLMPSYFPFVEPGAQFDVSCFACEGAGCRTCKGSGWIEMGGAGMVHPAVFEGVGYDSETFTGFAFGFGIDRLAMVKYDIDDIRLFLENDLRFLDQFRGAS